jgi:hypothetical protein
MQWVVISPLVAHHCTNLLSSQNMALEHLPIQIDNIFSQSIRPMHHVQSLSFKQCIGIQQINLDYKSWDSLWLKITVSSQIY